MEHKWQNVWNKERWTQTIAPTNMIHNAWDRNIPMTISRYWFLSCDLLSIVSISSLLKHWHLLSQIFQFSRFGLILTVVIVAVPPSVTHKILEDGVGTEIELIVVLCVVPLFLPRILQKYFAFSFEVPLWTGMSVGPGITNSRDAVHFNQSSICFAYFSETARIAHCVLVFLFLSFVAAMMSSNWWKSFFKLHLFNCL